ncbi:MAG: LysM peptidoglycan-binding domain-containing protein, partial [Methylococcales bacterium]|nr:LysM peptidoglycan-binding domain-containing protein [Methylococcales bacterium]
MKNTRSTPCPFLIGLLLNFFVLTISTADEIALNPTHPEKYAVVKGDTLWDISGKFLQHPWQWKELWKNNAQIKNPHLIYPNDTIYFSLVNGKPQLSLSRPQELQIDKPCVLKPSDYEKGRKSFLLDKNNKVLPCFRESKLEKPINLIPHEKIASFLMSPKVVSEEELENAPYVVGFHEGHVMAGTGDKIYVKNLTNTTTGTYTIYRTGEIYRDADTNDVLGYEARYMASATMLNNDDPATLRITKGTHEIRTGDLIMPNHDVENTLNFFPKPPEQSIDGHIIGVKDGMVLIGLYSVVVIDKGSADGLIAGHELAVYQKGKQITDPVKDHEDEVKLPDEMSGKIMIFRPFEHLSYALVMR